MRIESTWRRAGGWRAGALRAAAFIALVGVCRASPAEQPSAAPQRAGVAQGTSEDPCRFATAEAMSKAFGRPLTSSKTVNFCDYRGPGTDRVVVKVATGPEGTILKHTKSASAMGAQGVEKVTTAAGEAYFDSTFPVFIGRVGSQEVQLETTIQPVPRDAMVTVGVRIMESLARK